MRPNGVGGELRGDHYVLAVGQFAQPTLRATGAIHSRCIKEVDLGGQACVKSGLLISGVRPAVCALGWHEPLRTAGLAPDHDP